MKKSVLIRITAVVLFAAVLGGSIWAIGLTDRRTRAYDAVELKAPFSPGDGSGNTVEPAAAEPSDPEAEPSEPDETPEPEPEPPFMPETFASDEELADYFREQGVMFDFDEMKAQLNDVYLQATTEESTAAAGADGGSVSGSVTSTTASAAADTAAADLAAPEAPAEEPAAEPESGADHSGTNTQVANVDEADVIKTDGEYIYYLNSRVGVAIMSADGASVERIALIKPDEDESFRNIYIHGDKLVVVGRRRVADKSGRGGEEAAMYWWDDTTYTVFSVYDVADRASPVLERKAQVEGSEITTRLMDGVLYYVTSKYMYEVPDKYERWDILPTYYDTMSGAGCLYVEPQSIGRVPGSDDCTYLLVGGMDLDDPAPLTPKACLGGGTVVYMSGTGNIYVARYDYRGEDTGTAVMKFATDGAGVAFVGEAKLEGEIINNYAMDEHDGNFRVATTAYSWQTGEDEDYSNMYVFDAAMNALGRIGGIAPGERIYSVRFMGDTAYMVTFENMDPLFVIDMSVPESPVIKGELKIPGFSQYLHPLGSGYLVGIGRETTETYIRHEDGTEEVVGFRDMGFKLSLFDVRDVMAPKELSKLVVGGPNTYSDAAYDPKSIMVDFDGESGVMAFPIWYDEDTGDWEDNWEGGIVLSVTPGGFDIETKIKNTEADFYYGGNSSRFCYIGDTLYYIDGLGVTAVDYTTYERLSRAQIFDAADFPGYDDQVMPIETAAAIAAGEIIVD